ncbi:N-acylneuraminate cytidylyltransferase [bioreactor metagenome]|uniref:N-acylneuraminate cytidylyltransferase n=1 Tax=bioreactor metagenome TaxID=1076179 RepID=A0A644YV76_9ZZZZ
MKNIAIIPARSGSKGLEDKNIRIFNGKPLLAYSVEVAIMSGLFNEVFVSTDSEKYAAIGREYGAHVPFLRSPELSSDTASSWDAVKEALNCYEKIGATFHTIALLQPTSPLRTAQDITNAFALMQEKQANAVVSVCEVDHSPLWCNILPENGSMDRFLSKDLVTKGRQNLDTYYRINGAIYLVNVPYLLSSQTIYDHGCFAYKMDKRRSIDIDDLVDFQIAEYLDSLRDPNSK